MAKSKGKRQRLGEDETHENGLSTAKKSKLSSKTNNNSDTRYQDKSFFGQTMLGAGIGLTAGDQPNVLDVDQIVFQKNSRKAIRKHPSGVLAAVEELLEGLQNYIEDPVRLKYSLLPTTSSPGCESTRSGQQDSLMRLLLNIEEIQPSLMTLLLEKLPEFMGDDDSVFDSSEAANLPKLILAQFHWLDRISKSKEMTDKMLDMIELSSLLVQREIIACIPEVITDDAHNDVARRLRELLSQNSQLTVPILDALDNLNIIPELLKEVCDSALQSLVSADLEDLPVIIKFILRSINIKNAIEVLSEMRSNLDFNSTIPPTSASTPQRGYGNASSAPKKTDDSEMLILDTLGSNIRFNKIIAEGWIKAIELVASSEDHKVVDIFVLLIIHSINTNKRAVESLFRKKVRLNHFTEELLQATLHSHAKVIRRYFPSLLEIADKLMRSPEPQVSLFGGAIYRQAFLAFDIHCQQEIIGELVTHIGSGYEAEMDAALNLLVNLVKDCPKDIAPFAIFMKGTLDYLNNLTFLQIRKLFAILSGLAFSAESEASSIQDELHIVVRKQLSSNDNKYKRIGVVAAVMIVGNMATVRTDGKRMADDALKQVTNLLELVRSSSNRSPEVAGLYFDELATVVQSRKLDQGVQEWISESIINDFQDDFVVDLEAETVKGDFGLPLAEIHGLDAEESQEGVAINLLPLISKEERAKLYLSVDEKNTRKVSPLCLSPHFRLLRICEQVQNNGSLDGIDALLGCPIYNFKLDIIDKIESLARKERELICTCLFVNINWYREVVNAFAVMADAEVKGKVLGRLQNISEMEEVLAKCLPSLPGFIPPQASFDSDVSIASIPMGAPSTSGKGKRGRKKKSDKKSSEEKETMTESNTSVHNTQKESEESADESPSVVNIHDYKAFFRELDLDVFMVLGCGLVSKSVLDSDQLTKEVTVLQLQAPQLEFLLDDLAMKLDHTLVAAAKRRTFLKSKGGKLKACFTHLDQLTPVQVAKKLIKYLPYICQHLEVTSGFFQSLISENDGLLDGPGANSPEALQMGRCLQLLLKIMLSLFSWNGLLSKENKSILQESLCVLTSRIKDMGKLNHSLDELIKNSFRYIENFASSIPSLSSVVILLRLLVALNEKHETEESCQKIGSLAESFLKRDWFDSAGERCKGGKHNELIQVVLRFHLTHSEDVLKSIQSICSVGVPELLSADKNGSSTTYPTLTKGTFSSFYRIMLEELVSFIKKFPPMRSDNTEEVLMQRLIQWNVSVRVLFILISFIKAFDGRTNLNYALKHGRVFLEVFLRYGMPLMDKMFRTHMGDVQGLLKNLQQSTRALHHICSHTKVSKDVSLTNHVPQLKRILEQFVYRVKVMLTLHNCHEAFWLGNLKNRDLQGGEISSQVSRTDESCEEETTMEDDSRQQDSSLLSDDSESDDESKAPEVPEEKSADSGEESCSESY